MIKQNTFSRKNAKSTLKTLTVHQIDPFKNNPRRSRNPRYEEIKDSIRQTGLKHPFSVTKRPDSNRYVVKGGGNTRLAILKELYEETEDDRFKSVQVMFEPFVSEHDNLVSHLIENEMRGDLTLLERSLALRQAHIELEAQLGRKISGRETAYFLTKSGFSISHPVIGLLNYALDRLYPHIQAYLDAGMGKAQVERIRKFENQAKKAWEEMEVNLEQFGGVFTAALAACNDYIEEDERPRFYLETLVKHFCLGTAKTTGTSISQVQFFVDRAMGTLRRPSNNDISEDDSEVPFACDLDEIDHPIPKPSLDESPPPRSTVSALDLTLKAISETEIRNIHICLSFGPGAAHQVQISSPQCGEFSIDVSKVDLNKLCDLVTLDQQIQRLAKAINVDLWEGGCDD
jgi:ParB family protein of integrating conjugative element (PFGI_1 class)